MSCCLLSHNFLAICLLTTQCNSSCTTAALPVSSQLDKSDRALDKQFIADINPAPPFTYGSYLHCGLWSIEYGSTLYYPFRIAPLLWRFCSRCIWSLTGYGFVLLLIFLNILHAKDDAVFQQQRGGLWTELPYCHECAPISSSHYLTWFPATRYTSLLFGWSRIKM